jgi:hypothetical protein
LGIWGGWLLGCWVGGENFYGFLITFSNQLQVNGFKIQNNVKNDYFFIANSSQEFDSRIGVLVE